MNNSEKIMNLCLKNDEYLKTVKKALIFDEQDVDSFENTYHEMLSEMIQTNWKIHQIAEENSRAEFRRHLQQLE